MAYKTQRQLIDDLMKRYPLDRSGKAAVLEAVQSERDHFAEICAWVLAWPEATEPEKRVAQWIISRARGDVADRVMDQTEGR